jgi:ATP-dependent DNA helicase RecG
LKKTWIKPLLFSKITHSAFNYIINNKPELLCESLPENIIKRENLISRKNAILKINFPEAISEIEISRKRLSFDELFYLELILAMKKRSIQEEQKGIQFKIDKTDLRMNFIASLPYTITESQDKVINEILKDMESVKVMNRLLQGDVGSGKTIVAVIAMLMAIENGYQCAFMCPTEILAEQHYFTIRELLKNLKINISLLVGGQKKKLRDGILNDIETGKSNLIIGTHALIQEKVLFDNLGFVVIDEQHKFGVMQRAKLKEKGLNPDVLVMTATPIPRTLYLTYYGDLDISIIDKLPEGRKKIKTVLRYDKDKNNIYEFIKDEIRNGRQAYIIYPVIEESEKSDLKSAKVEFEYLKENVFKDYKIGIIHGKLDWNLKEEIMKNFNSNIIQILVATTVIEVGIDIPNATVMVIEEAQRFGLSQLHQLRGRVGRGADQSYCVLIGKNPDAVSRERLDILCKNDNGFEIAEHDMRLRGPGEFFGIRQSGVLNFPCTDLVKDKELLETARNAAFGIIKDDPYLKNDKNSVIRKKFLKEYKNAVVLMNVA